MNLTRQARASSDPLVVAESTRLSPVDEVHAVPRPNLNLHVEDRYAHHAAEQTLLHTAEGEEKGRADASAAEALDLAASTQRTLVAGQCAVVERTEEVYVAAVQALLPLVRRPPWGNVQYLLVALILLAGDAAGVALAAITFGDVPQLAIAWSIAIGTAAVTFGQLAADLKQHAQARDRQRDPDDLTDDERRFLDLFTGTREACGRTLRRMVLLGAAGVASIALGVLALRAVIDGSQAGLIYGAIALSVASASWINSWVHADEVADPPWGVSSNQRQGATSPASTVSRWTGRRPRPIPESSRLGPRPSIP